MVNVLLCLCNTLNQASGTLRKRKIEEPTQKHNNIYNVTGNVWPRTGHKDPEGE
jgi:hypothetical protein